MTERIQRRASRRIEGLGDMSYSERLSHTGLISKKNVELEVRFNTGI